MSDNEIVMREYINRYNKTKVVVFLTPKINEKFTKYEKLKKEHRLYTIERDDEDDE